MRRQQVATPLATRLENVQELSYRKPLPILRQRSKSNGLVDNVIAESRRPFSWCVALFSSATVREVTTEPVGPDFTLAVFLRPHHTTRPAINWTDGLEAVKIERKFVQRMDVFGIAFYRRPHGRFQLRMCKASL
ncbi:hypothetical protein J6590_060562 [Homalodisca vitripennis]|nr:hypothetical protein J6590_060562 [Homalodisca vitripennis]